MYILIASLVQLANNDFTKATDQQLDEPPLLSPTMTHVTLRQSPTIYIWQGTLQNARQRVLECTYLPAKVP